jgi:hypothetical protein
MQLRKRIRVVPKFIASSQRAVDDGGNPVFGSSWLKGNCSPYKAQARDTARRIVIVRYGALRYKASHGQREAEQAHQLKGVSFHLRFPLS